MSCSPSPAETHARRDLCGGRSARGTRINAVAARALLAVSLLCSCTACSTYGLFEWLPLGQSPRSTVASSTSGETSAVAAKNPQVSPTTAGQDGKHSAAAEALYRLGLAQADPTSGIRDYRAARTTFTELLIRYPRSRWDAEARAGQATLTDLLVREDEARRSTQRLQRVEEESKRTKTNLEFLKQSDLDREPRR
jgi:hypothetical protein